MLHFCIYAILVSLPSPFPLHLKKEAAAREPLLCARDLQTGTSSRLVLFQRHSWGFLPPLRTLSISWTRALLSSWSASHQPRDLVQRGRGCRWVLLLWGPHTLWAFSVKIAAPVLGADGQDCVTDQQCPVAEPPRTPGDRLCPAGPSLLHMFSPSKPTKPTASVGQEGIAASLAGRNRAGWDLTSFLVLNVRRTVPFHNIRLGPGHLP